MKVFKNEQEIENYVREKMLEGEPDFYAEKTAGIVVFKDVFVSCVFNTFTRDNLEVQGELKPNHTLVMSLDTKGNIISDREGRPNLFQQSMESLRKNYDLDNMVGAVAYPTKQPRHCIKIHEEMTISKPWGDQHLDPGSVLNITDMSNIYGIGPDEFKDTYLIIPEPTPEPGDNW